MTKRFTDQVQARTALAGALLSRGEPFLRSHHLRAEDLASLVAHGEAAREADRLQQVERAQAAQQRAENGALAVALVAREKQLAAVLPAAVADLRAARPDEAGFLEKLSFVRYRRARAAEPAPRDDAEQAVLQRVRHVPRADRATRAAGLAALCATLEEREAVMTVLEARGVTASTLASLRADAERVASQGSNRTPPTPATQREYDAVLAQRHGWTALIRLIERACQGDATLAALLQKTRAPRRK